MPLTAFRDEKFFLSNFYPLPNPKFLHGFPTVEHFFQAMKTTDEAWRERIKQARTPAKAKQLGKMVPVRKDWTEKKLEVMLYALRKKFQHTEMARLLDETGDEPIVETNWWGDTYWGTYNGKGENHLGKLLMQVREENRAG